MKPGFIEKTVLTESGDGRNDIIKSEIHFRDYNGNMFKVPIGATTDGGSTPRLAWLIPGFEPVGKHWKQWVLHDSAYRGTLLIRHGCDYEPANLNRLQSDRLLDRALDIAGMKSPLRKIVFGCLRTCGWRNFRKP